MYGDGDESPSVKAPLQRTTGQINPCAASSRGKCLLGVESGHSRRALAAGRLNVDGRGREAPKFGRHQYLPR